MRSRQAVWRSVARACTRRSVWAINRAGAVCSGLETLTQDKITHHVEVTVGIASIHARAVLLSFKFINAMFGIGIHSQGDRSSRPLQSAQALAGLGARRI